ncbi:hypothetical protein GA0115233_11394 [Streptomyces sp. DI166]|nr:hypothetical protein GA0115233_11394 [Streptomyces sp. DI166]
MRPLVSEERVDGVTRDAAADEADTSQNPYRMPAHAAAERCVYAVTSAGCVVVRNAASLSRTPGSTQ